MARLRVSSFPTLLVVCCLSSAVLMGASRGSITKLSLNPEATVVDLFAGQEAGQLEVRMVAESAQEGRIFITNTTDQPLTVSVPKGLAGVQVLPQFGQGNGFGFPGAQGFAGQGLNGQNGQNGLAQSVGGNASPVGNGAFPNSNGNNPFQLGNGPGFFSIPPEKTVQLAFHSVCLNYGRREPNARMKYVLVPAASVSSDPALQQLLADFSVRSSREAQQAAAWHLANGMDWDRLRQLKNERVPGQPRPYFTAAQLQGARVLVDAARKAAGQEPPAENSVAASSVRN